MYIVIYKANLKNKNTIFLKFIVTYRIGNKHKINNNKIIATRSTVKL